MEVIDCFEAHSRPRKAKRISAGALSAGHGGFSMVVPSVFTNSFSLHSAWKRFCGKISLSCLRIRQNSKFLLVIPAVAVFCIIPYGMSQLINYQESFFHKIDMSTSFLTENNLVEGAMSEFAFGQTSYYDSEGNIFTEDSVKVISSVNSIKEPVSFQNYTVKQGDTISGICQKFGLSNISTLIAVNKIGNVRSVYSGQKLKVPSIDGLIHIVSKNESIGSISKKYGASVTDIVDTNDLTSEILKEGMELFIPGARLDSNTLQRAMGEIFTNPLKTKYRITSRFGYRLDPITGVASTHKGLDMACPTGTPIYACRSGRVMKSAFSSLYGNYIVVEHVDGYQTLYAHMSKSLVKKGDKVSQGSKIGLVGSTGYSTGPHLHLTIYKNYKPVDPLTVIK
ncbi:M23 family metallopeptidase [Treponema sp.]|uniref:M23 family metallopeptidase n=1 Tax=Treponema sp. TaxID=166 RepID=UPI001DA34323|nr:M23 family metallopeptidase [Treponema sp.]MBS7241424.1 M23 family metallopeptidase [Treponema sp.]MCI6441898.1 M23 family metallopeptidase [Spirochaetia bacterium]MDY4132492.1 M23 family metallopeptidase [Treponema sp.]